MPDDTPAAEDILHALRASGYLMEQQVATQLERLEFHVVTNRAYEDPDEGKSREMDVWASKDAGRHRPSAEVPGITVDVELICECKNNQDTPFVFLGRPQNPAGPDPEPQEYQFPIQR